MNKNKQISIKGTGGSDPPVHGKKRIYMDYAAATPIDNDVLKAMQPYFTVLFGNAGAIYKEGVIIKTAIDGARKSIADVLNARSEEIVFTSGGTESNNLAIFGVISALEDSGMRIKDMHFITSAIEHSSVLELFKFLEKKGANVSYIGTEENGIVNVKDIKEALKENTVLVSIMYVNNEIGTIQPIAEIAKTLRHFRKKKLKSKIQNPRLPYLHTDASQAPLYFQLDVEKMHIDLMTLGGQKIYGPKGVGCLYKKRDVKINSIIKGGWQENKLRAGTENTPLIIGFAKALELAEKNREKEYERIKTLRDYFITKIYKKIPKAKLNGSRESRSPNNINVYIPNINGEFFVVLLDNKGITCATRSACKEGDENEGSYVIEALRYGRERAKSSLRFSLGKETTKKDIDYVIKILSENIKKY